MARITVNSLSTTDTTPIITGLVEFERFDSEGKPKETIKITINYQTYELFKGNLGIDETTTPNTWKLHISSPMYPGIYDVIAHVVNVNENRVIAVDETYDELNIIPLSTQQRRNQKPSLLQKFLAVNALMNSLNSGFGGQNGISPLPAVHPVRDDESSTMLTARDGAEGSEHPVRIDRDARRMKGIPLPPKRSDLAATGQAGESSPPELWSSESENANPANEIALTAKEQNEAEALAAEMLGAAPEEVAGIRLRSAPDEAAEFAKAGGFTG